MDRAGREPLDGVGHSHLGLEGLGVGPAQRMSEVEEEIVGDASRLGLALVLIELHHELDEFDRERGRAQQNVALAGYRDGRRVRILDPVGEVTLNVVLRAEEGSFEQRRNSDRGEASVSAHPIS